MKKIRIGGGQGFWGDSPDAAIHMMKEGHLDYMACDYLAELTMSIMARQKRKHSEAGYARDFVSLFDSVALDSYNKNIGILTNAGGMNVDGLKNKTLEIAKNKGMKGYKIATVKGDNLLDKIPEMIADGVNMQNIDDPNMDINDIKDKLINANVYYGHEHLQAALEEGANMVLTGRSTDSALFLAPLKKEFGWENDDWDNLARGIMAGHLLECGGQGAGGNFQYNWRNVPDMDNLGFPIAELSDDDFIVTKAQNCGGLVSRESVAEQLLYEVHDPSNYITPDVTVDLSKCRLDEVEANQVRLSNVKGKEKTDKLKLSIGYHAGYKVVTFLPFAWPDAYEKAQAAAEILRKKMERKNLKYEDIKIDFLGINSLHLSISNMSKELIDNMNEVVLRIAIRTKDKEECKKLIPEISPLQLNGPPGASFFGGRSKIQEVIALWPCLIPRELVNITHKIEEVK